MRIDNLNKFIGTLSEIAIAIDDISKSVYSVRTLSIRLNQMLDAGNTAALNLSREEEEQYYNDSADMPNVVDAVNFFNRNNQIIEVEIQLNEEEAIMVIGDTLNHVHKAMEQLREIYDNLRTMEGCKMNALLLTNTLYGYLENASKNLREYTGDCDTRLPIIEQFFTSRDKAFSFLRAIDKSRDKISVFGKFRQKGIITNLSSLLQKCEDFGIIRGKPNSVKKAVERWIKSNP